MKRMPVLLIALAVIFAGIGISQPPDASNPDRGDVTIAQGASLSTALNVGACTPAAIVMPAAWTAANLTIQVSVLGVNWWNLYDEFGAQVTITADASRVIRLNPGDWWVFRYIKIRSGTADTPVNQGGARTIKILCR